MNYQIITKTVSSQSLAAVRRRVRITEIGSAWKPRLDLVWDFLRLHEGCVWMGTIAFSTIIPPLVKRRWKESRGFKRVPARAAVIGVGVDFPESIASGTN